MLDVANLADISPAHLCNPRSRRHAAIRRIALIYDAKLPFDRNVMSGVASYVRESGKFNIYIEENPVSSRKLPYLKSWHGDGILADFDDPGVAAAASRSGVPVVGFGCSCWHSRNLSVPYFYSNQSAVADIAAEPFLERRFQHFAFCGLAPSPSRPFVRRTRGKLCHPAAITGNFLPLVSGFIKRRLPLGLST